VDVDPQLAALGYPKEFIQVILNLLGNAREAFRERKVDKPKLSINGGNEDNQAVITVTDNAGGIHDIPITDIFRLNFTTKESSGGTGIGLFMSRNIIEQRMGGVLTAENVGDGARFIIKLDRADSMEYDEA
jgi:signal transduction histidine kinase